MIPQNFAHKYRLFQQKKRLNQNKVNDGGVELVGPPRLNSQDNGVQRPSKIVYYGIEPGQL